MILLDTNLEEQQMSSQPTVTFEFVSELIESLNARMDLVDKAQNLFAGHFSFMSERLDEINAEILTIKEILMTANLTNPEDYNRRLLRVQALFDQMNADIRNRQKNPDSSNE
jgi:hypothetical protein